MRYKFVCLLSLYIMACTNSVQNKSDEAILKFEIHQEQKIYERSDYGEPPQFAIWLENKKSGKIKTVFVTYRTATGDFEGKAECPVSLPAWIGAFRKETGRDDLPTVKNPADKAITGATPKIKSFSAEVSVPKNSNWYYYIEMNVSGDYNSDFPRMKSNGWFDFQGNGQPSIVYRGTISGKPGEKSKPTLIGRTEQMYLSTEIIPYHDGITEAKKVFSMIKVTCH